jgi:hypothetical protein
MDADVSKRIPTKEICYDCGKLLYSDEIRRKDVSGLGGFKERVSLCRECNKSRLNGAKSLNDTIASVAVAFIACLALIFIVLRIIVAITGHAGIK